LLREVLREREEIKMMMEFLKKENETLKGKHQEHSSKPDIQEQ